MADRLSALSSFYLFQRAMGMRNREMFNTSEQLTSQKRINRPSDDPEAFKVVANFKSSLERVEQYKKNVDAADRYFTTAEASLTSTKDIFIRAKELALQGRNETLNTSQREAIASEVQQLLQQLESVANSKVGNEYVFSGFATDTQPFALDDNQPSADPVVTYAGSDQHRSLAINEGVTLDVQIDGEAAFMGDGTASTVDLFQTLADLEVALRTGDLDSDSATGVPQMIGDLDVGLNQILQELSTVGAKSNRLSATKDQLASQEEIFKTFISQLEDIDIAQVAVEYQRTQNALQAVVGSANSVLNMPSLIDFLR